MKRLFVAILIGSMLLTGCSTKSNEQKVQNAVVASSTDVNNNTIKSSDDSTPNTAQTAATPVTTYSTETKTESVAFQIVKQNDSTMEKGKEVVAQNGISEQLHIK